MHPHLEYSVFCFVVYSFLNNLQQSISYLLLFSKRTVFSLVYLTVAPDLLLSANSPNRGHHFMFKASVKLELCFSSITLVYIMSSPRLLPRVPVF